MWIFYALGSAFFSGITAILAKCGIRHTDSTVATALRTIVVLFFAWVMALLSGSISTISSLSGTTWVFLVLSGLATGGSWLCYFKALQLGEVYKVVTVDKCSVMLTVLLAFLFLHEPVSLLKLLGLLLLGIGTLMMIEKSDVSVKNTAKKGWLFFAILSAIFAALTAIFGKVGFQDIDSNLGTALRTAVVLVMAWGMVFVKQKQATVLQITKQELLFLFLSGLTTGAAWLCYYKALQQGPASVVVPIDKLSILISISFSAILLKEHLSRQAMIGCGILTVGTLLMLF